MKALLLAAGYGTRLRPITSTVPKCLVPIHGIPLLHVWITRLMNFGVSEIIVNTHYKSEMVTKFIETQAYDCKISIIFEKELLGTAGTLLNLAAELARDRFFVFHADNLSFINLKSFLENHSNRSSNCIMSMATFQTDTPETCGIVEIDANNILQRFIEKPSISTNFRANSACFVFEHEIFIDQSISTIDVTKNIDISIDLIPNLINKINVFDFSDYHRDIGSMHALEKAQLEVSKAMLEKEMNGHKQ